MYKRFLRPLFFSKRFYWMFSALIAMFIFAYSSTLLFVLARLATIAFFIFLFVDYYLLFSRRNGMQVLRHVSDRMSNGDENTIGIELNNHYPFRVGVRVIDELPVQFQKRNFLMQIIIDR